jgi:hypothetical protein
MEVGFFFWRRCSIAKALQYRVGRSEPGDDGFCCGMPVRHIQSSSFARVHGKV